MLMLPVSGISIFNDFPYDVRNIPQLPVMPFGRLNPLIGWKQHVASVVLRHAQHERVCVLFWESRYANTINVESDGHDTGVVYAAQWLDYLLIPSLSDANSNTTRTLILLTFDECVHRSLWVTGPDGLTHG